MWTRERLQDTSPFLYVPHLCCSSLETVIANLDPFSTCYRHLWRSFVPRVYLLWTLLRSEYRGCKIHTGVMFALLSFCFVLEVLCRDEF